ncbi:MAG: hypothetical protein AB7G75_07595 [Candidatus Binatia bacterium]
MTSYYILEKEFRDYAEDIEAVFIHYICTSSREEPNWAQQRVTRYMPVVQATHPHNRQNDNPSTSEAPAARMYRLRKKVLKVPLHFLDTENDEENSRYLFHHYFEIIQDGRRHTSPLYTEEVVVSKQHAEDAHSRELAALTSNQWEIEEVKGSQRRKNNNVVFEENVVGSGVWH